jgi:hypothetical protein
VISHPSNLPYHLGRRDDHLLILVWYLAALYPCLRIPYP